MQSWLYGLRVPLAWRWILLYDPFCEHRNICEQALYYGDHKEAVRVPARLTCVGREADQENPQVTRDR